ncbi:MAG: hypothetical protein ACRDNG_04065 [Gaiellaceae bacterium]
MLADAHRRVREVEARMIAGLNSSERRRLLELLRRCTEAIGERPTPGLRPRSR